MNGEDRGAAGLMEERLIIAGFGGQGILLIGDLLSHALLSEGMKVAYLPSYGVEMRGGTANCTVVVSDREVASPVVGSADSEIIMNPASLDRYEKQLKPGGVLFLNTSLIEESACRRRDIEIVAFPFNAIAQQVGHARLASMVALGAYVGRRGLVRAESLAAVMGRVFSERNAKLIPLNVEALKKGMSLTANGAPREREG